jgi:hypothetical protein
MTKLQIYTSKTHVQSSIPIAAQPFAYPVVPMTSLKNIDVSKIPAQNWTIFARHSALSSPPIKPMHISPRASDAKVLPRSTPSLEVQLFDNAAELKITLSQIVMHLAPEWRAIIFRQIDTLLDLNSWEDDSAFIQKSTFTTFLRFIIFAKSTRMPSLGVDFTGHLLAAWNNDNQRVIVEFFKEDQAAATFVKQGAYSGERETLAWSGHVEDLKHFIEQNGMMGCLQSNLT